MNPRELRRKESRLGGYSVAEHVLLRRQTLRYLRDREAFAFAVVAGESHRRFRAEQAGC